MQFFLKTNNIHYYIISIIFFLASIRVNIESEFIEGEVVRGDLPFSILFLQDYSIFIIFFLMCFSILFNFNYRIGSYFYIPLFYFIFHVLVILFSSYSIIEKFQRLGMFFIIFYYFYFVISKLNFFHSVKYIGIGLFLFSFGNLLLYFLIPSTVWNQGQIMSERLFGLTSHPNFTGVGAALGFFFSLYLFKIYKNNIYLLFLLVSFLVTLFSGSRNAVGMIFISFVYFLYFFYYKNTHLFFILLLSFVLIVSVGMLSFDSFDLGGRGFNRMGTWNELLSMAFNVGLIGNGRGGYSTSNGFLFIIAASGIIGSLFFYFSYVSVIFNVFIKKYNDNLILFFMKSLFIVLFFSSFFEGFLLDISSIPVFSFWFLISSINKI